MTESVLQLTRTEVRCVVAGLPALAAQFSASHFVRLPSFLAGDLRALVDARLDTASFQMRVEEGREIEERIDDESLNGLFVVALNDPRLFALVRDLTGCGPIGCFTGRLYRRRASRWEGDRYYPWHDDVAYDRLIGLSINLGRTPYEGGLLQFRDAATQKPLGEIANTGHADAVLFRVSEALEHQVTPVSGDVPRTVMAGWFCARPSYLDLLAEARRAIQ